MRKIDTSSLLIGGLLLAGLVMGPVSAMAEENSAFTTISENYEAIRIALLHDHKKGVAEHARAIEATARQLNGSFSSTQAGVINDKSADCQALLPEIAAAAAMVASAADLTATREAFSDLTKPMVRYREMVPEEKPVVVYCPMAKKAWLQPDGEIGNPYYGQSMARCGKIVAK